MSAAMRWLGSRDVQGHSGDGPRLNGGRAPATSGRAWQPVAAARHGRRLPVGADG